MDRSKSALPLETVDTLGSHLRQGFPALRIHLCSIHDDQGDVLWLSEGFLGPDEHSAVLRAYERFSGKAAPDFVVDDLGDGRSAAVLRAASAHRTFAGAVMLIVDSKGVRGDAAAEHFGAAHVTSLLAALAALLSPAVAPPAAGPSRTGAALPASADTGATGIGRRIHLPIRASEVAPEIDRLFAALRRTEIALHVQRLVPLAEPDGVRRFEVLLRAGATGEGDAAPQKMLTQATKAGLASMIDRRVVTTLLGWVIKHRDVWAAEPATFSINLSATSLRDEHFVRFVELCLTKANLPRGTIGFEVSEQTCLGNAAGLAAIAGLLDRLGCPLAIDDFSGSTRGFELLRTRGVRMIKFSEAVTANLAQDELKRTTLAGFVQMARVLGLHTVAKRVNEPAGLKALTAMGVGFLQAFSASRPSPLDGLMVSTVS